MENIHNQAGYSLQSELLTDQHHSLASDNHLLPTEFPYDIASFTVPTQKDNEEDDFFTGLTRQFALSTLIDSNKLHYAASQTQRKWSMSSSPQSILDPVFSNGSSPTGPFQGPSSPTSPFAPNDHSWSLICEAAGQANMWNKLKNQNSLNNTGLPLQLPNQACSAASFCNFTQPHSSKPHPLLYNENHLKKNCGSIWAGPQACQKGPRYASVDGCESVGNVRCRNPHGLFSVNGCVSDTSLLLSGGRKINSGSSYGGVKRKCAGTGVFLPRRCPDPVDYRLKSGCPQTLSQQKATQAMNMEYNDYLMNHAEGQPRVFNKVTPNHGVMVMRRNAVLEEQWRSEVKMKMMGGGNKAMNYEIQLPQEWSY